MDLLVQHLTFKGKCKDPMEQQDGGWEGGGSTMNFYSLVPSHLSYDSQKYFSCHQNTQVYRELKRGSSSSSDLEKGLLLVSFESYNS